MTQKRERDWPPPPIRTTTPAAYPQRGIVCHRCRKVVAATVSSHEIAWASWCMDCWQGRANEKVEAPK
jgi:hypothetical protein